MVATLLDLATGTPVAVRSMLNRQQPFGADVITRISATMLDPEALDRLRGCACRDAAGARRGGCAQEASSPGTSTRWRRRQRDDDRARARHRPRARRRGAVHHGREVVPRHARGGARPRPAPARPATVFPALGAYVGGDIVAGLLATGMTRDRRLRLFIDVGTNCEIALGSADRLVCTAAPAGPAFEAAQIRCGMRAADGAIEVERIGDDALELRSSGRWSPPASAARGSSTARRSSSASVSSTSRAASSGGAGVRRPELAPVRRARGRGAGLRAPLEGRRRRRRERRLPVPARRPRAAVRQGRDRDGLEAPGRGARHRGVRDPAGPARRLVRLLPRAGERGADRARAAPAASPYRLGRQRGGRGSEDGAALDAGADAADAMFEEVEYVELSDRADFNDRFIEQLAFPETS